VLTRNSDSALKWQHDQTSQHGRQVLALEEQVAVSVAMAERSRRQLAEAAERQLAEQSANHEAERQRWQAERKALRAEAAAAAAEVAAAAAEVVTQRDRRLAMEGNAAHELARVATQLRATQKAVDEVRAAEVGEDARRTQDLKAAQVAVLEERRQRQVAERSAATREAELLTELMEAREREANVAKQADAMHELDRMHSSDWLHLRDR
jgi:hypothetical protein